MLIARARFEDAVDFQKSAFIVGPYNATDFPEIVGRGVPSRLRKRDHLQGKPVRSQCLYHIRHHQNLPDLRENNDTDV